MSYDPTQQVPPPQIPPTQQSYSPPPYQPPPAYVPPPVPVPVPVPTPYTQYSGSQPAPGPGFNFSVFWQSLGLSGQVSGLAGLVVLICFVFPWFANATESYNGFSSASGSFDGVSLSLFPYLWLVLLGAIGLAVNAWFISRRRLPSMTTTIITVATSAVMLALEICFLSEVNSFFELSDEKGGSGGAGVGFWLAAIATAAALGVGIYAWVQQRRPANPYQAPVAQPYAAPYQSPPQYPVSPPPPYQYPNQPPPYPGQ